MTKTVRDLANANALDGTEFQEMEQDDGTGTWFSRRETLTAILTWMQGQVPTYTVANLPASATEGQYAFASDGLKQSESTGNGTGVPVYFSGGVWRDYSDDTQVAT